jgi:hypothetical protein
MKVCSPHSDAQVAGMDLPVMVSALEYVVLHHSIFLARLRASRTRASWFLFLFSSLLLGLLSPPLDLRCLRVGECLMSLNLRSLIFLQYTVS